MFVLRIPSVAGNYYLSTNFLNVSCVSIVDNFLSR